MLRSLAARPLFGRAWILLLALLLGGCNWPQIDFTATPQGAPAGSTVSFKPFVDDDGPAPAVPDSVLAKGRLHYQWDFGNGTTLTASTPAAVTTTYAAAGTYTVTLKASSELGWSDTVMHPVVVVAPPAAWFEEPFDGTAVRGEYWTKQLYGVGDVIVSGGIAAFGCSSSLVTQDKKEFQGSKFVVEARFSGVEGTDARDTVFALVERGTGDRIQVGDYNGLGFYVLGSGQFLLPSPLTGGGTVSAFKEYRLTVDGQNFKVERGDTLQAITETILGTLPSSVAGKTFYLLVGVGGPSSCPGAYDWVRVKAE